MRRNKIGMTRAEEIQIPTHQESEETGRRDEKKEQLGRNIKPVIIVIIIIIIIIMTIIILPLVSRVSSQPSPGLFG